MYMCVVLLGYDTLGHEHVCSTVRVFQTGYVCDQTGKIRMEKDLNFYVHKCSFAEAKSRVHSSHIFKLNTFLTFFTKILFFFKKYFTLSIFEVTKVLTK